MDEISSAHLSSVSDIHSFMPLDSGHQEQWFDAIDTLELDDTWFDASEDIVDKHSQPEATIEAQIPLTEDCLRGLKQLINILAEYKHNELISLGLSKLFPTIPFNIIMAADTLYSAISEKRNLDLALLTTLGLTALYYQDNDNIISQLALFIKKKPC